MNNKEALNTWITSHYVDVIRIAKSQVRGSRIDFNELIQESVLKLLNTNIPQEVIDKEIINFYFYRIAKNAFLNMVKAQNKFSSNPIPILEDETFYDDLPDQIYQDTYTLIFKLINTYKITRNDGLLFLLYHYPQKAMQFYDLTELEFQQLQIKNTYRKLGELTGIKWNTVYFSIQSVLKIIRTQYGNKEI